MICRSVEEDDKLCKSQKRPMPGKNVVLHEVEMPAEEQTEQVSDTNMCPFFSRQLCRCFKSRQ
jgi:hypothetical protein